MRQSLRLDRIRESLGLMEDRIIFTLFERSQYAANAPIYRPEGVEIKGFEGSFLDYLLQGTERLDWAAGRYDDRREHPFFPKPDGIVAVLRQRVDQGIARVAINRNDEIKSMYIEAIKGLCRPGDDNEYGTCARIDIRGLQEISGRVHLGEFVAESKWRSDEESLRPLVESGNRDALEEALRDRRVERKIAERVGEKGDRYGIDSGFISDFYVNHIIPLTISVEVEYLMKRAGKGAEPVRDLRVDIQARKLVENPKIAHAGEEAIRSAASRLITIDDSAIYGRMTPSQWEDARSGVIAELTKISVHNKAIAVSRSVR